MADMTQDHPLQDSRHGIQFRTACDPCSNAKVRCDKEKPVCGRCAESSTTVCWYSQSRKHGKQSRRKRLISYTNTPTRPLHMASPNGGHAWNGLLPTPPSVPATDTGRIEVDQQLDPIASWEFGDEIGIDIDVGSYEGLDVLPPPTLSLPLDCTTAPPAEGAITPSSTITHDCEAQAISLLGSLQHQQLQQGVTTCSTDPLQYPNLNLRPGFDRVIAVNKAVLSGWSNLMQCSCAQCPHLIMLYISVLTKMLFWYRIAARETASSPVEEEGGQENQNIHDDNITIGDSSDSSTTSSPPSWLPKAKRPAPTVDRFGVSCTEIRIGTLSLDSDEQAGLRRVLLLKELRRTEEAIDELVAVDSTAMADSPADSTLKRAMQWGTAGISLLKEDLHELMQLVGQHC